MLIGSRRKIIAFFFMSIFSAQLLIPGISYALTSGPSQPEMAKFQPAGASDLVDLFTGDLNYNIPLLDVGGYPINLSYQSGTGMEDEASWVGTGWTLNPGAVNRTLRGLPDDFNGSGVTPDLIDKEYSKKEFKKVGAKIIVKPSLFAWEKGKIGASLSLNVYKDNYYGIGAAFGASIGYSMAENVKTPFTVGLDVGINSDTRSGVDFSPSLSLSAKHDINADAYGSVGLSGSLGYNTRSGLKNISLTGSFSTTEQYKNTNIDKDPASFGSSAVHYFGQTYTPSIGANTSNSQFAFNFDLGPSLFGGYVGFGGAGYLYKEKILDRKVSVPAYGYLNYLKGRKNPNSLLDMNREKDGVFITSSPSIPIPVATQDYFTASGQTGSQQFRPYFAGNYIINDRKQLNTSSETSVGVTIGAGNIFKAGGRVEHTQGGAQTGKWTDNNNYILPQEAAYANQAVLDEPTYFKQVGEHTAIDNSFANKIGSLAENVVINRNTTTAAYKSRNGIRAASAIKRDVRERRNHVFSYLTAMQAQRHGLDKLINGESRVTSDRKQHHISEITVTDNEGKRMVYGTPVYNTYQEEVSFAVTHPTNTQELDNARQTGLISYTTANASVDNQSGRDRFFSKEITHGYASSFLLTGVLSPDYVDITGDGISDDDLGTAVKFNYTKLTTNNTQYQWRAPYDQNMANFNEGFMSSSLDDRANYIYGKKEIWYLQSIESKTMIAFFDIDNREDGLGVLDSKGGKNTTLKLKKLNKIRLYSKADFYKNGQNAVPIKTANFEYDYSIYPNVPNNSGEQILVTDPDDDTKQKDLNEQKGKLTLKRVYFTFGASSHGISNPYDFGYDTRPVNSSTVNNLPDINSSDREFSDNYTSRQSDRWGTYKKSFYNRVIGGNQRALNNAEFPYTMQENDGTSYSERQLNNLYASKWQLVKIVTPTNNVIQAEYETDDYAFVQNKRAMQMCFVAGINSDGNNTGLMDKQSKLLIQLPLAVANMNEFKERYLRNPDGSYQDKLFYKIATDMDNRGHFEFVNGYAEINLAISTASGNTASLAFKENKNANPIAAAAWQMLRTDMPEFAYDNYDNLEVADNGQAAIRSIITSLGNLRELTTPFDQKARSRNFGNRIDLNKSMVRLNNPDKRKMGGGCRVKKIMVSDQWQAMSGIPDAKTATYGQLYDYTIKDKDGNVTSSSGVAAYEPQLGNEENPFHEPVPFTEKVHWSSDKYHYIEKPYCESYFPAATVGYSKVTVTSFGDDYTTSGSLTKHTGYIENEFYTAKEFPTIVDNLDLDQNHYENSLILKLFSATSINRVTTSQGFKIELNDMHGKSKAVKVYNKGGDIISSSEYFYSVKDANAEFKELDNSLQILQNDGSITTSVLASDIDMITDVRESKNESIGTSIGGYTGGMIIPAFIFPIYIPYVAINFSNSITRDTYNSISTLKVVHKFGILVKTKTIQNGSTIEAQNLLWDGQTGEVLLTRTQNEFDDYTYAFNYPAYMVSDYERMGAAYKNIGTVFNNLSIGSNGNVTAYSAYLTPGDELVSTSGEVHAWVISSANSSLRLVDRDGNFITGSGPYMILRSGRRNMLSAGCGTVVLMQDPRINGSINLNDVSQRILDSKAIAYKEEWIVPQCNVCPVGYTLSGDGSACYKDTTAIVSSPPVTVCDGDSSHDYSSCGSYIYTNYINASSYIRHRISPSNPFWIGYPGNCGYTPADTVGNAGIIASRSSFAERDTSWQNMNSTLRATNPRGPLNRTGVWICSPGPQNFHQWYGFSSTITVPETKTYYVGLGADNSYRFKVDGTIIRQDTTGNSESFKIWHIYPIILTQGQHIIELEGRNNESEAAFGAEIYNKTAAEIEAATNYNDLGTLIFSTANLANSQFQTGVYSCPPSYVLNTSTTPYSCRLSVPVNQVVNPYYKNLLGNWRPYATYVYTVNREQRQVNPNQMGGTDIRRSGYYSIYTPFWAQQNGALSRTIADNQNFPVADPRSRWVYSNKSIYYDKKGNEVESVDALGRYSAALYGYQESLVTAVSANARRNEIMFDGFEDYDFDLTSVSQANCGTRHFDFGLTKQGTTWTSASGTLVSSVAHSGKYSYRLSSGTSVTKNSGNPNPLNVSGLGYDGVGRYVLTTNGQSAGFAPIAGKKYLISFWANDHNPGTNKIQNLLVRINGQDMNTANTIVPVVEGWKRVEYTFTALNTFKLEIIPSGSVVEIDDIRIFPVDAQMNTHVYDAKSLRLMAQLDENNFASYYEYDDEGILVRVKKETERGVMTLKENRQMLKDRTK